MGWFGHGKYDGDETASTQIYIVEQLSKRFKFEILDKKGKAIAPNNLYSDEIEKGFVHSDTALHVLKHLDFVLENLISRPKKNKKDILVWNESAALDYMMVADFFMNHKLYMPDYFQKKSLEAVAYLTGEHAEDFTNPEERKQVLNKFIKKLTRYSLVYNLHSHSSPMDPLKGKAKAPKMK